MYLKKRKYQNRSMKKTKLRAKKKLPKNTTAVLLRLLEIEREFNFDMAKAMLVSISTKK